MSTVPIASACSSRRELWPKSPKWASRSPSSSKTKIVLGPRSVPACSSCSEATASTSPIGELSRPAVERSTTGSPSSTSTALWSKCSWVISARSGRTPEIKGYSNVISERPIFEMSPNGSMNTVRSPSSRRKADCPYHSTCMLLLPCSRGDRFFVGSLARRLRLFTIVITPAPQQRRAGGDQAGDDRERERLVQARAERRGDQVREERAPRDRRVVHRREQAERVRADQVFDRVVAEERREQDRDGRDLRRAVRRRGGDSVRLQPRGERVREVRREAEDHQREEDADRQDLRRVLERLVHAAAGAAIARRQAVH